MKAEITISNRAADFAISMLDEFLKQGGMLPQWPDGQELAEELICAISNTDRIIIAEPR